MTATFPRRLLDAESISLKLGQPHGWFADYRGSLEAIGFPKPCLPADAFGSELWDERSIDLWLDGRMDSALLNTASRSRPAGLIANKSANKDWETKLNQRAREMHL